MNTFSSETAAAGGARTPGWVPALVVATIAAAAFHVAFLVPALSWVVVIYLGGLFVLRRVPTARRAFYLGLLVGLGVCVPQMSWLWTIFGVAAIPLWLVLAFWIGLFLCVLNRVQHRWSSRWAVVLAPVLWTGLEYFRSELYWLKFAWFTAGSLFVEGPASGVVRMFGVYGAGFVVMALAAFAVREFEERQAYPRGADELPLTVVGSTAGRRWFAACGIACVLLAAGLMRLPPRSRAGAERSLRGAGIQLEFPGPPEVLVALDRCLAAHPAAELFVLSEYSFDGPVSGRVKRWCREHGKWLIAGGKEPLGETNYFNTAFVVSTNGEVVFQQAKSVPLQFFTDGRPAPSQRVWDSPWGPIGILICYDVSYSRVGDELIRQGARTLIAPALDAEMWGATQHRQNARMTLLRSLEYGVPIFRVAGSGISQLVSRRGELVASAPFPGQGEMLSGELRWHEAPAALPLDRWLTLPCVVATALSIITLMTSRWRVRHPQSSTSPVLTTA